MTSRLALALSVVLACAGAACSDDDKGSPIKTTGDGSVAHPDAGQPDSGGSSPDSGAPDAALPDGGAPGSLTLLDYVNDLVDHHTDDTSAPDDVASRTIVDNQDPAAFNSRFP